MTQTYVHIPNRWRETTLGEVADIIMWQSPSWESYNFDWNGLPFYQWVTEFWDKYIGIKSYTTEPTKIVENWTLLFSVRAPVWRVNFVRHQACIWRWNAWLRMKNWKQEFLFYLLKHIEKSIQNRSSWTVFDSISWKELKEIPVTLPENPDEQKAIADILSSLDAKIELLREQNETLEKTAQTIFQEWFGKYSVDEPESLPEGWRVGKLGEIVDIKWGWTPSTQNPEFWNGNIAWTSPKDLSNSKESFLLQTESKITPEGLKQISSWLLPIWTLLLSSRAPIWYLAITNIEVAINQGYIAFIEWNYFSNKFMYLWLKTNMQIVLNSANGSTFLEISKSSFRNIECIIPDENILKKFEEIITPSFEKILLNLLQIQSLSKTRDTLLPKLMSGEVRVKI
jgi:type I restriction enzyme, S subunit